MRVGVSRFPVGVRLGSGRGEGRSQVGGQVGVRSGSGRGEGRGQVGVRLESGRGEGRGEGQRFETCGASSLSPHHAHT